MRETFTFPDIKSLVDYSGNYNIVVVSIIGKSCFNSLCIKVKPIGRIFSNGLEFEEDTKIEGYFDDIKGIVYLHVESLLDADQIIKKYKDFSNDMVNDKVDFLSIYDRVRSSFVKTFFTLFYISHIIVISHPTASFDLNYIQYFKAVDVLRKDYHNDIIDLLKDIDNINSDWIANGRPCRPRILFYFEQSPKNVQNVKKLEHNLEDCIHRILKRTRIINNTSAAMLFSIPLNDEYVFIANEKLPDKLGDSIKKLQNSCSSGKQIQVNFPFSMQPQDEEHCFINFLSVHIDQARDKGFEDICTSRHTHLSQSYFELPHLKQWASASQKIYKLIMQQKTVSCLSIDIQFSEQRCRKVLPLALAHYQEGLPNHYTKAIHETRQNYALALFAAQARGPMFQEYSEKLLTECQNRWESGRQLCEAASLTGNPCTKPKHLPEEEHCSGVRYVAACDCGRIQGSREDPYNAKQANYTFYHQLSKDCVCSELSRIHFPIFEPSIKEYKAASLEATEETFSISSDHSTDLTPDTHITVSGQASTTEYLPGMLTLSSPPGLLPYYSSWSLVCLGPSSLYSHNLGLSENHHPGFINSTNYLLPWDVSVYSKIKPGFHTGKQQSLRGSRRPRLNNSMPLFTVKVFIGLEYECPRGHRFMLAAPDRVLRAAPGSIVKDTGKEIAKSDMPLYYNCPCRSGKQRVAQLMRLHVVTPKAPVYVTVDPKIQPATGAPLFVCSRNGPTNLTQSAYWVMRLPYIYVSDKEHYAENTSARLLQGVFNVVKIE